MIPRVLEPEVMDSADEAREYNAMDHREVNRAFVGDLLELLEASDDHRQSGPTATPLRALDVGTGTALIPIEWVRRCNRVHVTAVDLSANMLDLAAENVSSAGLAKRISVTRADAKDLPCEAASFDAVISNSIVHHIPEPASMMAEMLRVLRPGGLLFVRDLLRPPSLEMLDSLVDAHAMGATTRQRQLFRDSLHAALTLDEIQHRLEALGMPRSWARQTSDRHWTVCGLRLPATEE